MTSEELITMILELTRDSIEFLLPVMAFLSAITLLLSFILHITFGVSRRF